MPLLIRRVPPEEARDTASRCSGVGLAERVSHTPGELSGGERQRAALARPCHQAACVLATSPPNLDRRTAENVFELMLELNRAHGTSLVMVTHEPSLARGTPHHAAAGRSPDEAN